jgi:hypothetical protein
LQIVIFYPLKSAAPDATCARMTSAIVQCSSHILSDSSLALYPPESTLLSLGNHWRLPSQIEVIFSVRLESASPKDFQHHLRRQHPDRSSQMLSDCSDTPYCPKSSSYQNVTEFQRFGLSKSMKIHYKSWESG